MRLADFAALLLVTTAAADLSAAPPQELRSELVPSITVVGTGEVQAKPDTARVNVGVVTEAPTAAEAVQSNSRAMEQLLKTLREQGIEEKHIRTVGFTVSPKYQYRRGEGGTPEIIGYTVTNQVQVTVRDLPSLGEVLDKVVRAGANQINGIGLTVHDPEKLLDDARRKAVDDARRKAELYARAAGVELGRPILIQEATPGIPEPVFVQRGVQGMSAEAARPVPIATGEQTLSANVTVTYALQRESDRE